MDARGRSQTPKGGAGHADASRLEKTAGNRDARPRAASVASLQMLPARCETRKREREREREREKEGSAQWHSRDLLLENIDGT